MSFVCLCVVLGGTAVIPWMVAGLEPAQTFVELFQQLCAGSVVCLRDYAGRLRDSRLVRAFVGTAKDALVAVDLNLPVTDVCRQFGWYVRLNCEKKEGECSCVATKNAFEIMMVSQKSLSRKSELPSRIEKPRNNKDRMFNDLVSLFASNRWKWSDGGDTHGSNFISNLRDALWYLDGHHSTLATRSCSIPEPFDKFEGYNMPERSKHRKRRTCNLSFDVLIKHVAVLKESLLSSWMQQSEWRDLKERVSKLTTAMDDYCTYLRQQCKTAKTRHDSVAAGSDSGTLTVLPLITVVSSRLTALNDTMKEKPCYERVFVNDYSGTDPKKKYQYVQDLRKGLTVPAVLYTCSLGSNLGNYLFIWKLPRGVTLEAATNENIRIINVIKDLIPTYHSRALRKAFVDRFGLIAGGVKSYILRQIYHELTGVVL